MKILLLFLITLSLFSQTNSIDEQIAQLQYANPQDRYKLMNAIKVRISSMNTSNRIEAISKLQKNRQILKISNTAQMQQMNQQQRKQNYSLGKNEQTHQGNGKAYGNR